MKISVHPHPSSIYCCCHICSPSRQSVYFCLLTPLTSATCSVTCVCLLQPVEREGDVQFRPRTGKAAATPLIPEVEAYLQLLLVVYLTNNKHYAQVSKLTSPL